MSKRRIVPFKKDDPLDLGEPLQRRRKRKKEEKKYTRLIYTLFETQYHTVESVIVWTLIITIAFQIVFLILARFLWQSDYLFYFYLFPFVVEWGFALSVLWAFQDVAVEEIGTFSFAGRFYFCFITKFSLPFTKYLSITFFLFFIYFLIWMRPLFIHLDAQTVSGRSSCSILRATGRTFNPNGIFPFLGEDEYNLETSYTFCPLNLEFGGDNLEDIKGFDRISGVLEFDQTGTFACIGSEQQCKDAYPNPGRGIESATKSSKLSNAACCPSVTSTPDVSTGGFKSRKICSSCLQRLAQDNGNNLPEGHEHCPFDPNGGTSFFCAFCPGIWINDEEKFTEQDLLDQAIVSGVITFLPFAREFVFLIVGVVIEKLRKKNKQKEKEKYKQDKRGVGDY